MISIIAPNPFPFVPVTSGDREALYGGLISAAYSIDYARRQADTLPDDDGSLQMLARHRMTTAAAVERLLRDKAEADRKERGARYAEGRPWKHLRYAAEVLDDLADKLATDPHQHAGNGGACHG